MKELTKLFFYLVIILIISLSINNFKIEENDSQNKMINTTIDYNNMMNILKKDNELLEMILNEAKIIGPNKVSNKERQRFPAIFKNLPHEVYKAEIKYNNRKLMVLFDKNKIYKKVNLMNLKI